MIIVSHVTSHVRLLTRVELLIIRLFHTLNQPLNPHLNLPLNMLLNPLLTIGGLKIYCSFNISFLSYLRKAKPQLTFGQKDGSVCPQASRGHSR